MEKKTQLRGLCKQLDEMGVPFEFVARPDEEPRFSCWVKAQGGRAPNTLKIPPTNQNNQ